MSEIDELISKLKAQKENEDRETMLEVVVGAFKYGVVKNDEIDLALELFAKRFREDYSIGSSFKSSINTIRVRKSEVEDRRSIW